MLNNSDPINTEKKVCIIVPVYNAEKYLGYCLNSILSQTYTNWNAILVNDGSTDSSLEICEQYAAIDARFQVFSKTNGGVSSARNYGLMKADGDYLEFLDSDDCLAHDTLEKQIRLAEKFNTPLVMMDIMMVDFSEPELDRITLSSAWLEKSPCQLSAEEFKNKKMQLVWYTVLLECLHAKLYNLKLWKENNITFPEDLSLGEDFVANMKYFDLCDNVVFLHECGHYYNCIMGSNSLTQKYRKDLFENKMLLMERLEEHLGGRSQLSHLEKDAFYCYAASNGLTCVEKAILESGMNEKELHTRLEEMFANPLFAESIRYASYIPDRFAGCINQAKENDFTYVIQYVKEDQFHKKMEQNTEGTQQDAYVPPRVGLLNRAIRKGMRTVRPIFGQGAWGDRITRWEREFAMFGLKKTLKNHRIGHKKVNKGMLDVQTQQLESHVNAKVYGVYSRLDERCNELENKISNSMSKMQAMDTNIQNKISNSMSKMQAMDTNIQNVDQKISTTSFQIQEKVNGDIWYSEQRMMKYAYQNEINELRQKKKAIMLATAEHANIGDAAITLAEQQVLYEQFPEYFQMEISTYEFERKEAYLHAILNPKDIIFINGGGNLGDRYIAEEELHRKIVSEFPNNQIIIFPQTISFSSAAEIDKSAKVYNAHKDLTLFVRGEESLTFAKKYFGQVKTILMPDMVHALVTEYVFDREGVLLCLREDEEGKLDENHRNSIKNISLALASKVERSTNMHSEDIPRENRAFVVHKEMMRFAHHKVVVTDRLHGMIFSAITGTPCVVLSSCDHKIEEYYKAFFADSNAVFYIGNDLEKLESAIKEAILVEKATYPVFEKHFFDDMRGK